MAIKIEMPRLSDTMEEGTLVKWNVKVGDKVKAGDEVAEIETDKATMPLPVYDDGVVAKLAVQPGETLKVGALILVLATGGETAEQAIASAGGPGGSSSAAPTKAKAEAGGGGAKAAPAAATDEATETITAGNGARIKVSPLARRIAEDRGVDLARIKGTGPDGRIIKRDVINAPAGGASPTPVPSGRASAGAETAKAATPASTSGGAKLESTLVPVSQMRKTIARRLLESKTTIPHFTVTVTIAMDALLGLRTTLNDQLASQNIKLSVNDFVVRAAALSLAQHPLINASWTDAGIQQHGSVNIGIAVALPADKGGGLVVPVIRDALKKGLRTVSAETKALAEKARTKGLSVEEMSDGTFTISNLGMLGVDHFEAIINPPQAAILAVGAAIKKPVVRNDQLAIGTEMTCTISADHRVVDGAMAADYLQSLKKLLENPAALLV